MTSTPPVGEPERQWQQPAFQPGSDPANAPLEGTVYSASGSVVVPYRPSPPPSVAETVIGTMAGLVWPVVILLAIMGVIGWWPGVMIALVGSVVLGNLTAYLKARRKALGRGRPEEQSGPDELR